MVYFLGIDGGGTKTECLLGDESIVLAAATVGGSNIVRLGEEKARAAIHEGICKLCAAAKINPENIAAVWAGVGGAAEGTNRERMFQILRELIPGRIEVAGDMIAAHQAALHGEAGIIVISGTGSIAYGRNEAGRTARFGGWGYMISDEGSGHWIGVQAVASVVREAGQGRHTALQRQILEHWGLSSVAELVQRANASPLPDFAALFPVVLDVAEHDIEVRSILERAGAELARITEPVYRALWDSAEEATVALAGGVFQRSATVRDSFSRTMTSLNLNVRVRLSADDPATGALSLARKLALASTTSG